MEKLVFRSWPKLIFSWPTAFGAALAGLLIQLQPTLAIPTTLAFLLLFSTNLMVLGFEFSRAVSMTLFFALAAAAVSALWLNQSLGYFVPLQAWIAARKIQASYEFYYAYSATYLLMFALMYLKTRFDYWELTPNELVHKKGLFGKNERFSTQQLRFTKEIPDLFEYLIGGAGRLIIQVPGRWPIFLENVIGIRHVEAVSDKLLDANVVRMQPPGFPSEMLG